ncbi:DNA-binding protein [bacterium]|nr:DNA-binding protein [bacterium]
MPNKKITVEGVEIVISTQQKEDYISLTDMAKYKKYFSGVVISNWLTTKYTIQFLGAWEQLYNPNFNVMEFHNIKNEVGTNGFIVSSSMWINKTNAIGLISKAGRHGGGTFAHKDIAFEFGTWLSPEFKLYLIKEFQRLKEDENTRKSLEWDVKRLLAKVNYKVHTDAVKENLIPAEVSKSQRDRIYSSEGDVLNVAMFGMTALEWREKNLGKKGNIRDYANVTQLVCLAGLESLNAEFIRQGLQQGDRLKRLNEIAIIQMRSLTGQKSIGKY